jgi:hypothetical protein
MFCAEVLLVCDLHELRLFWGTSRDAGSEKKKEWSKKAEVRRLVWDCFVQKWKAEGEWHWEGAVVLLGVPFVCVFFHSLLNFKADARTAIRMLGSSTTTVSGCGTIFLGSQ